MQVTMKPPGELSPIGQRLKLEMKKRGVTSTDLARRAEVRTSFLYDIFSGKSANPSTVKLARVADQLGINVSYLVGITQTPDLPQQSPDEAYMAVPHVVVDIGASTGTVVSVSGRNGEPFLFRKAWIQEHLRVDIDNARVMTVRGDSMEPTLCHNDTVLIDLSQKTPSPPGLFVVFDGFGLAVKRIEQIGQQQPPRLHVSADNSQYSSYDRSADETFIIGRVVWFARGT